MVPLLLLIALPQLASSDAIASVSIARAAEASADRWAPAANPQQREVVRMEAGQPVLLRLTEYH